MTPHLSWWSDEGVGKGRFARPVGGNILDIDSNILIVKYKQQGLFQRTRLTGMRRILFGLLSEDPVPC